MSSPQQPALPDISKDDSVITGKDWKVFKLKKIESCCLKYRPWKLFSMQIKACISLLIMN